MDFQRKNEAQGRTHDREADYLHAVDIPIPGSGLRQDLNLIIEAGLDRWPGGWIKPNRRVDLAVRVDGFGRWRARSVGDCRPSDGTGASRLPDIANVVPIELLQRLDVSFSDLDQEIYAGAWKGRQITLPRRAISQKTEIPYYLGSRDKEVKHRKRVRRVFRQLS